MSDTTTIPDTTTSDTASRPVPVDPDEPYLLERDQGEHLHFLNHLATRKVTAGADGALSVVEFLQSRGFGPPLHCHADEDEVIVVLDGEVAFRSGDSEFVGHEGALAFLPKGVPHTFQVLSGSARCLAITASKGHPPVFDQMVAELGVPTDEATLPSPIEIDPVAVARVNARYGIEILGPPPAPLDD